MQGTLLVAGLVALAAGLVYLHVARRLPRPAPSAAGARALRMFSLWWYALAANMILVGATYILGAIGALGFEAQLAGSYFQRLLLSISMVGLMHYLLYLLTGRDLLVPLALAYGAYYLLVTYAMLHQQPDGLFVGRWRTDLTYALPALPYMRFVSLAAILLPPILASLAYLRLAFRVQDPTRRWRIVLVSGAILFWWAVAVAAGQRAALDDSPIQVANRALSLLAAFAVLAAYSPPRWAQRRWRVARASSA